MAKKIKFPLEMKDGVKVRTLEELRNNFDAQSLLSHFISGKLHTWLIDRRYDSYLEEIKSIDPFDENAITELCKVLEISNSNEKLDLDAKILDKRNKKIKQIKQVTDEIEIIENIDCVATNQNEFDELLINSAKKIYLYGDLFCIPADIKDVTIIGINNPTVKVDSSVERPSKNGVSFNNIQTYKEGLIMRKNSLAFTYEAFKEILKADKRSMISKFEGANLVLYKIFKITPSMSNPDISELVKEIETIDNTTIELPCYMLSVMAIFGVEPTMDTVSKREGYTVNKITKMMKCNMDEAHSIYRTTITDMVKMYSQKKNEIPEEFTVADIIRIFRY